MVNVPEFFQTWNFNWTSGRNTKTCRIQVIVSVKHFLKTWYIIIVIMNMYFIAVRHVIIFIVRIKDRVLHKLNFICKYIFSYCLHFRMSHKCFVVKINDSANREPNFLLRSDFYLLQTILPGKNLYNPTILNLQLLYMYTIWILVAKTELKVTLWHVLSLFLYNEMLISEDI